MKEYDQVTPASLLKVLIFIGMTAKCDDKLYIF